MIDLNVLADCVNFKDKLNPSNFPMGSAYMIRKELYNPIPYLCDLLKVSTDPNITANPLIVDPATTPYSATDVTAFTSVVTLTSVGDPRVSYGEVMSAVYVEFIPRILTRTEVLQAGGVQVINNIVCNSDGFPIEQGVNSFAKTSIDLTGKEPLDFGMLHIPATQLTFDQLMTPIQPVEVQNFITTYVNTKRATDAQYFASFIITYFPSTIWGYRILNFPNLNYLIVELTKDTETKDSSNNKVLQYVWIKYFDDSINTVACNLGLATIDVYNTYPLPASIQMSYAMSSDIQNFTLLMSNPAYAEQYYNYLIQYYSSTSQESFTNMFTASGSNTYLQTFINSLTSGNLFTGSYTVSSVDTVNCQIN